MDVDGRADDDVVEKDEDLADGTVSKPPESHPVIDEIVGSDKTPEWVEWRESSDSLEPPPTSADASEAAPSPSIPNGELVEYEAKSDDIEPDSAEAAKANGGGSPSPKSADVVGEGSRRSEEGEGDSSKG